MASKRLWVPFCLWLICLGLILAVWGCSGMMPSATPISTPFFVPTLEDAPRLATLTHELDKKALHCMETADCEQVYFARALVSLFENQEASRASFRHVLDDNPASPLAVSSQLWLRLIGNDDTAGVSVDSHSCPMTDIVAQYVRDWMERQLTERPTSEKLAALTTIQDALVEHSRAIQALQKQVSGRDRQIAGLRSQLEALRLIDQDREEKQRKVKPPASLIPTAEHLR